MTNKRKRYPILSLDDIWLEIEPLLEKLERKLERYGCEGWAYHTSKGIAFEVRPIPPEKKSGDSQNRVLSEESGGRDS